MHFLPQPSPGTGTRGASYNTGRYPSCHQVRSHPCQASDLPFIHQVLQQSCTNIFSPVGGRSVPCPQARLRGRVRTVSFDLKGQTCFTISEIAPHPVQLPLGTCTGFANRLLLGFPGGSSGALVGQVGRWDLVGSWAGLWPIRCVALPGAWLGFYAGWWKKGFWS